MRFLYEYRTKDNVRQNGEIAAPNRDAAFVLLKARGIRPSMVKEAPGLANKVFGKGKRWLAIVFLSLLAAGSLVSWVLVRDELKEVTAQIEDSTRRQIIGDSAIIEKGIRTGWSSVFKREGDRFLAGFALPGVPVAVRSTTASNLEDALSTPDGDAICNAPEAESFEGRQIRAIVAGMKAEIRSLLNSGWTLKEVGDALVKRQDREIGYYQQAKNEIEKAKDSLSEVKLDALWERKNDELRKMGIRLVPMPD